jgi:hypothetical protein
VFAGLRVQIDQLHRNSGGPDGSLDHRVRLASKSDHGTVMIGVHRIIERRHARNRLDGFDDQFDLVAVAAFAEIRNAFDDLFHRGNPPFRKHCQPPVISLAQLPRGLKIEDRRSRIES